MDRGFSRLLSTLGYQWSSYMDRGLSRLLSTLGYQWSTTWTEVFPDCYQPWVINEAATWTEVFQLHGPRSFSYMNRGLSFLTYAAFGLLIYIGITCIIIYMLLHWPCHMIQYIFYLAPSSWQNRFLRSVLFRNKHVFDQTDYCIGKKHTPASGVAVCMQHLPI
jgi:hypothetical protein